MMNKMYAVLPNGERVEMSGLCELPEICLAEAAPDVPPLKVPASASMDFEIELPAETVAELFKIIDAQMERCAEVLAKMAERLAAFVKEMGLKEFIDKLIELHDMACGEYQEDRRVGLLKARRCAAAVVAVRTISAVARRSLQSPAYLKQARQSKRLARSNLTRRNYAGIADGPERRAHTRRLR